MRIKSGLFHTAKEVAQALSIPPPPQNLHFEYLCTDSREVQAGDLFVCLRGERYDGHAYLAEARRRGASLFLCEGNERGDHALSVPNTYRALARLASEAREKIAPTVIAVTGSVGKTTTKDMIAATLAGEYATHKTEGNHNNLLGLSLTILSMPPRTRYLTLELGMNHTREIAELSSIARPDIAVITNVGQAHIGELGSREAIARAKLEILEGCAPGTLYFYPAEERLLIPPPSAPVIPFPIARVRGADNAYFDVIPEEAHTRFSLDFRRWRYEGIRVRGVGAHVAACAAFAVCIGDLAGVSHDGICKALLDYEGSHMRQEVFSLGGVTIIEDCYNASPESMQAALASLFHIAKKKRGRALALLGGMRELGTFSPALHQELGRACAAGGLDLLFLFGKEAKEIARGARGDGMRKECIFENEEESDPAKSAHTVAAHLQEGDVLLIKASRALGAERVSEEIKTILRERGCV